MLIYKDLIFQTETEISKQQKKKKKKNFWKSKKKKKFGRE